MSEFVTVNGKKYQTSGHLSGIFSYTPDYIGKLAREEKILGIQIERQWFIEPMSLEVYLQKIEIEKKIQKDILRNFRKNERISHERKSSSRGGIIDKKYRGVEAAAQALLVLVCGAFIGGLSFVSVSEELTPPVFAQGVWEVTQFIGVHMKPILPVGREGEENYDSKKLLAGVLPARLLNEGVSETFVHEENNQKNTRGVFAVLPKSAEQNVGTLNSMFASSSQNVKEIQFSDDVRIAVDAWGAYYFEPVLRQETAGAGAVVVSNARIGDTYTE